MKYIYKTNISGEDIIFESFRNPQSMEDFIDKMSINDNLVEFEDMNTKEPYMEFARDIKIELVREEDE